MNRELSIGNWGGMSRRNWGRNPPEDALCKWDGDVQEELGRNTPEDALSGRSYIRPWTSDSKRSH